MSQNLLFSEPEQSTPDELQVTKSELRLVQHLAHQNYINYNQGTVLKADLGANLTDRDWRAIAWTDAVLALLKKKGLCPSMVSARIPAEFEPDAEY